MFSSESQYIGFDVGKQAMRVAKVRKIRQGWDVLLLKEITSVDHVNLLYKQLKEGIVVASMQTRDVLFRMCEIPLKKTKDIFAALDFHVEPLLPYPLDKAVLQAQVVGQQEHSTSLTVLAVRKDHLQHYLELLKNYAVEPEIVTTKAHALAAFSTLLPQTGAPILLVHEGEEEITIVLIDKGQIISARAIDPKKEVGSEIQKTLLNLSSSYKSKSFETIYFIGKDPGIKQALQTASGKPLLPPSSPFLTLTQDELIQYGLAIGCAIAHKGVNFRQKEFSYPHPFRRVKKPLALFFSLSLLLTLFLVIFSETALSHKKQGLAKAYTALLQSEGKSAEKIPSSPTDFHMALAQLEKEVQGKPNRFPLLPQVPKVKEVLSWLAAFPSSNSVVIESIHYNMVKRPDFSSRQERYKVRVDLELSAAEVNAARRFQDDLKTPNPFVDASEEVQWIPTKGKYKASFYLKDKTKYD